MISTFTTQVLLVRSGGRCAICYQDLLTSNLTWKPMNLAERAHNVGRTTDSRSPRGDDPMPLNKRDQIENLLLLCGGCHTTVDAQINRAELTVDRLRQIKLTHEARIEALLAVPPDNKTTVLRMQGIIGGDPVHISPSVAAATVLHANRYARFDLSPDRSGIEIDLRQTADPEPGNRDYYAACVARLDQFFNRQLLPAAEAGQIEHLSVFALARWPLLVHLGARLADKVTTDIYQRHRSTESWMWPTEGHDTAFRWDLVAGDDELDAVLVLSLSAAVHRQEIPHHLANCASYRITPVAPAAPHYEVIGTKASLRFAELAFRDVLADIELHRKDVKRLHVIGAAPLSACISLGRAVTRGVHPQLVLYDRVEDVYQPAT